MAVMVMEYPRSGIAPNDIADIPRLAFGEPTRHLRLRIAEVYVVPAYPLMAFTGVDLATGKQLTVWVDPAWVQIRPPNAHVLPRAS
jgi:hypothetical protein